MFRALLFLTLFVLPLNAKTPSKSTLSLDECLFIKYKVPSRGIVCSNCERALRLSSRLTNAKLYKCAWGPFVMIGDYKDEKIFIAACPVGTGAGLIFTELCVAGAKYILRYGSDDVKAPPESDALLVKIVDEADNLYGFNIQSGVDSSEWGKSLNASPQMVEALITTASSRGLSYETRICHHLENYHALRNPDKYPEERRPYLKAILDELNGNPKKCSFDMESAVLFRVAKDFNVHAATVLQTVNKEGKKLSSYEGKNKKEAIEIEEKFFFSYVLDTLLLLPQE